jgi:ATP synthase F1 gamma subunit
MAKKIFELKKEILNIEDTKKTLKALEKISSANLHSLKITIQRIRQYEKALREIFIDLEEFSHPLFEKPKAKRKLKVLIGQEKGFTGGLTQRLLDFLQKNLKENEEVLILGEKTKKLCQELKIKPKFFFPGTEKIPQKEEIQKLQDLLISEFLAKRYQEILIIYPFFKNFGQQIPKEISFLPIDKEKFKKELEIKEKALSFYPIYEPSKKEVFDYLVKMYLAISLYQKILEGKLSELSSRVLFMEEAAERANNLVKLLLRRYLRKKREIVTKAITDLYSHRVL